MRGLLLTLLITLFALQVRGQDSASTEGVSITPSQHKEVIEDLDWSKTKKVWRPRGYDEKNPPTKNQKFTSPVLLTGPVFQILGYIIIILLAMVIIYVVFKNVNIEGLPSKDEFTPVDINFAEDINEIDAETELERAIREGDYRRAFSMKYVLFLQHLSAEGNILWRPHKTNRDYILELSGYQHLHIFRIITRAFERSLYGTTPFEKEDYDQLAPQIHAIIQEEKVLVDE